MTVTFNRNGEPAYVIRASAGSALRKVRNFFSPMESCERISKGAGEGHKAPRIRFLELTTQNRFLSTKKYDAEQKAQPSWKCPMEVSNAVVSHLQTVFPGAPAAILGGSQLLVIGEVHNMREGLLSALESLVWLRGQGLQPKFMPEVPDAMFRPDSTGKASILVRNMQLVLGQLDMAAMLAEPARTRKLDAIIDYWCTPTRKLSLTCALATRLGFELHGCDPIYTAGKSAQHRELKMVDALAAAASEANRPVVAFVGCMHADPLLQDARFRSTIGIVEIPPGKVLPLGRERQRFAHAVDSENVLPYRTSEQLQKAPLAKYLEEVLGVQFQTGSAAPTACASTSTTRA
jgi:hypothetical protein